MTDPRQLLEEFLSNPAVTGTIDLLQNPERNAPPEIRARAAGLSENGRREALARAAREAADMQADVDHEEALAATRERHRRVPDAMNDLRRTFDERDSAVSRGTGIGPWIENGLRHPVDTAASGVIALENLRRFLQDEPGQYPLADSMQGVIDRGRVDAAAHPSSEIAGKVAGGYLLGALGGESQSVMAAPGYLAGLGRYLGTVGSVAGINAMQDAAANPDRPETARDSAISTLTNPLTWLTGLAGEGLGYLGRNAEANGNQATRLGLDSLGIRGRLQNELARRTEARGATELAAEYGMSPEDALRRGREAGGAGQWFRDAENEIRGVGREVTDQGDVVADALVPVRDRAAQAIGETERRNGVTVDTRQLVNDIRTEATRHRGENNDLNASIAEALDDIAKNYETRYRGQPVWRATGTEAYPPPEGNILPSEGGRPILDMVETSSVDPMTLRQAMQNRRFLSSQHAYDEIPRQGDPAARSFVMDLLNERGAAALPEAERAAYLARNRQFSVLGPDDAADGLINALRDRAAGAPGSHLELAARQAVNGNAPGAAVSGTFGNLLPMERIADIRSGFNRTLSDAGRVVPPSAVGAASVPAAQAASAVPGFQLHRPEFLGGPGGQPAEAPQRGLDPLSSHDGGVSIDDFDDDGTFRPRQSAAAPSTSLPTPPPATSVPRTFTIDDFDDDGNLLPHR